MYVCMVKEIVVISPKVNYVDQIFVTIFYFIFIFNQNLVHCIVADAVC